MTGSSDRFDVSFAGMQRVAAGVPGQPSFATDSVAQCVARDDAGILIGDIRIDYRRELARDAGLGDGAELSDPALFLHGWRRWGVDVFRRVEGEFAVAIWDSASQALVVARDALGHRPLFFRRIRDGFAFASLPLPLSGLTGGARPDLVRLAAHVMALPDSTARSFVADVERVKPGHWLSAGPDGAGRQQAWWTPDLEFVRIGLGEAIEAADAELRRAVAGILPATGVVAADLSAGLDSSLVVATAAAVIDDRHRLLSLTALAGPPIDSPPDWPSDEVELAAQTAAMNGVSHRVVQTPPESPFNAIDRWIGSSQAPVTNACNVGWLDSCYAAARDSGAQTYLTGCRGNFTISRPAMARLSRLGAEFRLPALARELLAYRRFAGGSWPGLLAMAFADLVPDSLWNRLVPARHARENEAQIASGALLRATPTVRDALAEFGRAGTVGKLFATETPVARQAVTQTMDEGSGNHAIRKRYGLEVREPLATRRMVELCMRLPTESYFRDGRPRALARDLLKGRAPGTVLTQRSRGWQGANWRAGFEPAISEMIAEVDRIEADPELAQMFDVPRMRALLLNWPAGNWNDWDQIETYRNTLFRAIGAARFARFVREWNPGQ